MATVVQEWDQEFHESPLVEDFAGPEDFDCAGCAGAGVEDESVWCDGCSNSFHSGRCFEKHLERSAHCRVMGVD